MAKKKKAKKKAKMKAKVATKAGCGRTFTAGSNQ